MVKKDKKVKKSKKKVQQLPASVKALLQYMSGTSATIGNYPVKGKATETSPLDTLVKFLTSQPAYQAQAQQQSFKEDVKRVIEEERKAREEQTKMLKESQEQLFSRYEGTVYGGESRTQMRALEELLQKQQGDIEQLKRIEETKSRGGRYSKEVLKAMEKEKKSLKEAGVSEEAGVSKEGKKKRREQPQYNVQTSSTSSLPPAEAVTMQQTITPSTQQIQSSGYSATLPKAESASPEIARPTQQLITALFSKPPSKEEQPQEKTEVLTKSTPKEKKQQLARGMMGSNKPEPSSRSEITPIEVEAIIPQQTTKRAGRQKSSDNQ